MNNSFIFLVVLIILDGWGYWEDKDGNVIVMGKIFNMDSFW